MATTSSLSSSAATYTNSPPCAACKFLRRKCMPDCTFSPYFPPHELQKFAIVHRIFGASNVSKLLSEVLPHQREDAAKSLAYEAEARMKDPVYGCAGVVYDLQRQLVRLQKELDDTNADLFRLARSRMINGGSYNGGGAGYGQNSVLYYPNPNSTWNVNAGD